MSCRTITLIALLACVSQLAAQPGDTARHALNAKLYDQESELPLLGALIKVIHNSGHIDSLFTDTMGVARTSSGLDTLSLPFGLEYNIQVQWPAGVDVLRDKLVMDPLFGSAVYLKEYFIRVCTHGTDERWLPPSVYFLKDTSEPRTDSAWYQQEAQVNSVEKVVADIVVMMQDNPTMVVMMIGYCDALEKDCERLALARANYVRNQLVENGIPPERLQTDGRADTHQYSQAVIDSMKDHQEREKALGRDRHVGYSAISYDYKP